MLVSTVSGTKITFLSINCNNVKIDLGLKSPINATTSPLLISDKLTDSCSVILLNLNSSFK